jgi:hypothetical protein
MKHNIILAIVFLAVLPFLTACSSVPGYHETMQGVQDHVDYIRNANAKIEQGQLP